MQFTPTLKQETVLGPLPTAEASATAAAMVLALAGIEQDSAQASDSYLCDTVVPHGGE